MQSRIQQIVTTTARAYGYGVQQPQQPCVRCSSRMSDSDILLGYCKHCTDALVDQARKAQAQKTSDKRTTRARAVNQSRTQAPKTRVIKKLFYPNR